MSIFLDGWSLGVDSTILSVTVAVLHILAIWAVLFQRRPHPSATLAWILALIFVPGLGVVFFWLFGSIRLVRVAKRSAVINARIQHVLQSHGVTQALAGLGNVPAEDRTTQLLRLGDTLASTPASSGNRAELLVNGAATYRSMLTSIAQAQDHVHVEFYIIQPDRTGVSLRDRLVAKAEEGVEVRVLVDAVGSMSLPRNFWAPLIEAGGRAAVFGPVGRFWTRIRQRDRIDFRNHRKIVVVDGRVGFTGGINVGREYLGLDPEIGHWRDTHIRIEGPAVVSLQQAFAEDWLTAEGEVLDNPRYYPVSPVSEPSGFGHDETCIVQVVDSGPDRNWSPIVHMFAQAIALARVRVWITNPYFVPDVVLKTALISAALRGVDVRLLLPSRADHPLVSFASRSYYAELLEAGVKIFEYSRGFMHAKTMVVDSWVATVGSANMDMRSFQLNFELNALVFGASFADQLAGQFRMDLEQATPVDNDRYLHPSPPRQLLHATARLLSPLL